MVAAFQRERVASRVAMGGDRDKKRQSAIDFTGWWRAALGERGGPCWLRRNR